MRLDDQLYKAFLDQMRELESFRMLYAAEHPSAPLDREDPDVRRLVEACAFFAARTHEAGIRNIYASRRRLFQQFFPYLLSPLPALGLLQAKPTRQFAERVTLPKDSEIAVSAGAEGTALFRTSRDIEVMPLFLRKVDTLLRPDKGFRVVLSLNAPYPRDDEVGTLRFQIDYLNDFHASLRLHHALREHIQRTSVAFDENVDENTRGIPCELKFEAAQSDESEEYTHPLLRERLFFHFPQVEMFVSVSVPPPPRNWWGFKIMLDLDSGWPRNLRLNQDIFKLNVVPITNLHRALGRPIKHTGTREKHAIHHLEPDKHFELHSVVGVFRVEKNGMLPLRPGILGGGTGSFELEETTEDEGRRRHWLMLHFPEAFEEPKTISIDALWMQPWFSQLLAQRLTARPYGRNITGLKWELLGSMTPHSESRLGQEMEAFMHLFALQNKSLMNADDLVILLQTMGSVWKGQFSGLRDALKDVSIDQVPDQREGPSCSLKLVYYLRFKELDPDIMPLLQSFTTHITRVLDAWIPEARVEARVDRRSSSRTSATEAHGRRTGD